MDLVAKLDRSMRDETPQPEKKSPETWRSFQDTLEIGTLDYDVSKLEYGAFQQGLVPYTFPILLSMKDFGEYPSRITLEYITFKGLIEELKRHGTVSLACSQSEVVGEDLLPDSCTLVVKHPTDRKKNIIIYASECCANEKELYPQYEGQAFGDYILYAGELVLYCHPDNQIACSLAKKIYDGCRFIHSENKDVYVEMIVATANGLSTQRIRFELDYKSGDLDLHYGPGFSQFNEKLLERVKSRDKGIVMFHGPPGNGKTHYIRRLFRELSGSGKRIILIPKHILSSLESPALNTFMLQHFVGQKILFIIEDAESIIAKRDGDGGGRSELVTTLLNITDGILNDIFSIQVILTFNTSLKEIDEALLRKGRLIAKYLFDNLDRERAELLAEHLGVRLPDDKSVFSVADIYALKELIEDDLLINQHLVAKSTKPAGF